jgi:transcriptional regulator with XRE-family HTH domain
MVGKRVNDIDLRICNNIRDMRKMLGMTQQVLANMIGLTSQQLHKYEAGMDRVSAGMLAKIAKAFNCNVSDLYCNNNEKLDTKNNFNEGLAKVAETGKTIKTKSEQEEIVLMIKMLLNMPKHDRDLLFKEIKQKTKTG